MKILITGGCGFVGSNLAIYLKQKLSRSKIFSLDNLCRNGSSINLKRIKKSNIKNYKIDLSKYQKVKKLPRFDLIIDCCSEPSVEFSKKDPDKVISTNFIGTYNILKKIVKDKSKIIFLSSSRVYSLNELQKINFKSKKKISEKFSTSGAKSFYGFTKLASEDLIKEFSYNFNLKYLINRFGVISGPWQFGKQDQGFVSLWVARHIKKINLKFIGFGGTGNQIRDIIHISDVCELIYLQIKNFNKVYNRTFCVGGGRKNLVNLKILTKICSNLTGIRLKVKKIKKTSNYDIPYYVTDNTKVKNTYGWYPKKNIKSILIDIYEWLIKNKKIIKHFS